MSWPIGRDAEGLDRHITGNYGEDQFKDACEDEDCEGCDQCDPEVPDWTEADEFYDRHEDQIQDDIAEGLRDKHGRWIGED